MTTVSTKTFLENPIRFFNLARKEDVAVKRGRMIFRIMPEPQIDDKDFVFSEVNPSPSGDPYFADPRNVAEMERRFKEIEEGKVKIKVLTPERQKELLGL